MGKSRLIVLALAVIVMGCLGGQAALAQTTGQIEGTVTDRAGDPLPGVTVVATSPSLQGARTTLTDTSGRYVFGVLPSGTYQLKFSLDGYTTTQFEQVLVQLGGRTETNAALAEGNMVETVTVTADRPLIQKTADTSTNLGSEVLDTVPIGVRDFRELTKLVPSITSVDVDTSSGRANGFPSIRGEGQYGDNYLVDGLTVREPGTKTTATPLPFDAIEEVQIVTDGFSPEYGQALGGVINVITKIGSNTFDGDAAYLYTSDSLAAEPKDAFFARPTDFDDKNPYVNLAGPFMKDQLWYFFSYNRDDSMDGFEAKDFAGFGTLPSGVEELKGDTLFGKLTWAISAKHNLAGNYTWQDDTITGLDSDRATPEARLTQDRKRTRLRLNYQAIFNPSSILEAKFGNVRNDLGRGPSSGDFGPAAYNLESFGIVINNAERLAVADRKRDDWAAIFTQFWNPGGRGGAHEFKGGIEFHEPVQQSQDIFAGIDEDVFAVGQNPDEPDFGLADTFNGGSGYQFITETAGITEIQVPTVLNEYRTNPLQENRSEEYGVFLQDRMEFGRWNFMLGLRADKQKGFNDINEVFAEYGFGDALSPRAYATWDATGNGKNVAKVGVGRFYDVNGTRFGEFANTQGGFNFRNYTWAGGTDEDFRDHIDDGSAYDIHNPANWAFGFEQSPTANPISYDQVEGPARVERLLLEYNRLIKNDYVFKTRYVNSKARRLIDDVNELSLVDGPLHFVVKNTDLKRRDYQSFELEFNGTPTPNFAFNMSYVHSASKGTSPGQFETDGLGGDTGSSNDIGVFLDKPESNPQFWCDFYGPTCVPGSWNLTSPLRDYNNDDVVNQFDRDLQIQTLFDGLGSVEGDDGWYGYLPYSIDDLVKLYGRYTIEQWGDAYITGFLQWASGYHTQRRGFQAAYGAYLSFEDTFAFEFVDADGDPCTALTAFADCDTNLVQNPVQGTDFFDESGTTRGSRETGSYWSVDLAVGKNWNLGKDMGLETRLELFNVTNNQIPLTTHDRAAANFGEPLTRQGPRQARAFVRLSF